MDMESKIAELERKQAEMSSAFAKQAAIIASQALEIERLNRLLAQKSVKTTSRNSHLPPSKDLARNSAKEILRNQSLREKSDKPVGGQKGHEGHTLEMTGKPDAVKDLIPDYCNNCGLSLEAQAGDFVGCRQVIDIPPISPITTEYRQYRKTCPCGNCQYSAYPQEARHPIQYGPNIQSLVIYQNV